MVSFMQRICASAVCIALLVACGDDGSGGTAGMNGGECLAPLDLECSPSYSPTFDEIYSRRIAPTCGAGGASCHGAMGHQAGLTLADADGAYDALRARLVPGDPECSLLMKRLESEDPEFVMPVGLRLSPGERCAFRLWIANGAER